MFIAPKASFNRPDNGTAYGANELVANSATVGDVVPMRFGVEPLNGKGRVNAVRLFTDDETVTNANFNLHLFTAAPVPSNGDNAAFAVASARQFLGTVPCDLTSGAFVTTTDKAKRFAITGGLGFQCPMNEGGMALHGLLESAAAYDPDGAELFEVCLEIEG